MILLRLAFAVKDFVLWFAQPSNLVFLSLAVVLLLMLSKRVRAASWLLSGVLVFLLSIALLPVVSLIGNPLETRFPIPDELPGEIDGIIVLGGVTDSFVTRKWGQVSIGHTAERLTESVVLARRHPEATLVFTGGPTQLPSLTEADVARMFYSEFGVSSRQLVLEQRALNTYQNMRYSRELVDPRDGAHWLLVTSAMHMPRAVGVFAKGGWDVIPYPVDFYSYSRPSLDVFERLADLDFVVREWVALIAFRLLGYTGELLPAP